MDKLFTCDDCGAKIKTRTNLRRHIDSTHSKTMTRYACSICDRNYSRKSDLKRHTATLHLINEVNYKTTTTRRFHYHPTIEPIKKWTPTFEATPRFRIVPAEKPWLTKTASKTALRPTATYATNTVTTADLLEDLYLSPSPSSSGSTVCLDEPEDHSTNTVLHTGIYGVFTPSI